MRTRQEEKRRKGKQDSKGVRGDSSGSRAGGEKGGIPRREFMSLFAIRPRFRLVQGTFPLLG